MRLAWRELRGPVSALVLLGLLARLLLAMPALAMSAAGGQVASPLCLSFAELRPKEAPAATPAEDYCALCRLPEATGIPPPVPLALAWQGWTRLSEPSILPAHLEAPWRVRGPPPARAPPAPTGH